MSFGSAFQFDIPSTNAASLASQDKSLHGQNEMFGAASPLLSAMTMPPGFASHAMLPGHMPAMPNVEGGRPVLAFPMLMPMPYLALGGGAVPSAPFGSGVKSEPIDLSSNAASPEVKQEPGEPNPMMRQSSMALMWQQAVNAQFSDLQKSIMTNMAQNFQNMSMPLQEPSMTSMQMPMHLGSAMQMPHMAAPPPHLQESSIPTHRTSQVYPPDPTIDEGKKKPKVSRRRVNKKAQSKKPIEPAASPLTPDDLPFLRQVGTSSSARLALLLSTESGLQALADSMPQPPGLSWRRDVHAWCALRSSLQEFPVKPFGFVRAYEEAFACVFSNWIKNPTSTTHFQCNAALLLRHYRGKKKVSFRPATLCFVTGNKSMFSVEKEGCMLAFVLAVLASHPELGGG